LTRGGRGRGTGRRNAEGTRKFPHDFRCLTTLERRPAISELVLLTRRSGPEQVMQPVEERAPNGFDDVSEPEEIATNYERVAGFQFEGLNAKPPIG
jgi:hypothetical protein